MGWCGLLWWEGKGEEGGGGGGGGEGGRGGGLRGRRGLGFWMLGVGC